MTVHGRSVPRGLADVLAALELTQPTMVTLADIAAVSARAGVRSSPPIIADRLRRRGWLLPTGQRGIYEFAPGAHAGPFGHGDPFLPLRAALAIKDFQAAIALQSALWLYGLSDRAPDEHELAAAPGAPVPDSVKRIMRVLRFQAHVAAQMIDGLPVHHPASLLVQLAHKPSSVKNWFVFLESLPDLVERATLADGIDSLQAELISRPRTTTVRLAYLLSGVAPGIAQQLQPGPAPGVVYFGPRRATLRFSSRFNVADTILPSDPLELTPLAST